MPRPRYVVEGRVAGLEIRVYEPQWVAETTLTNATWEEALAEGSKRLLAFISGNSHVSSFRPGELAASRARPMATALAGGLGLGASLAVPLPLASHAPRTARAERLPMLSPVSVTTPKDRTYTMVFNLPRGRTLASLPAPNDERVRLERRPRRRVAVLEYRGRYSGARVAKKFSELLARVRDAGLPHHGSPEFASYDPASTLPFLRRNEVWIELDPAS